MADPDPQSQSPQKPAKADVQTLAYLLREIEIRLVDERRSRKQFALSMIIFGFLFICFGALSAGMTDQQNLSTRSLATLRGEPEPEEKPMPSLPFAIGFSFVAYGFSKSW